MKHVMENETAKITVNCPFVGMGEQDYKDVVAKAEEMAVILKRVKGTKVEIKILI